jgi:L-threonylcarbamoyladenylate synthase
MRKEMRCGLLAWQANDSGIFAAVRQLSGSGDLAEAAANLFRCLRELDRMELDLIVAEAVPERGLGSAIMDRLRRAAAKRT